MPTKKAPVGGVYDSIIFDFEMLDTDKPDSADGPHKSKAIVGKKEGRLENVEKQIFELCQVRYFGS